MLRVKIAHQDGEGHDLHHSDGGASVGVESGDVILERNCSVQKQGGKTT